MPDRKSDREPSAGVPSASSPPSSSIRVGSSVKSRPAEGSPPSEVSSSSSSTTGAIRTARADSGKPLDSSELLRSNALLFLIAGVFATTFAITELATGHFREIGASYLWLIAAAVLSWTAFFLRDRGQHGL